MAIFERYVERIILQEHSANGKERIVERAFDQSVEVLRDGYLPVCIPGSFEGEPAVKVMAIEADVEARALLRCRDSEVRAFLVVVLMSHAREMAHSEGFVPDSCWRSA